MSQQQGPYFGQSAGPIQTNQNLNDNVIAQPEDMEIAQLLKKRRECTNFYVELLYKATWIQRPGDKYPIRTSGRKNKNEVLGLILARLLKEKYVTGTNVSHISQLLQGISTNSSNGEFVLVLRTDGRVIIIGDEAEYHLSKSMRSLYAQCINIFECLDEADGEKLRAILNSAMNYDHKEHRLVCTLRLPKGKRPSRDNEDVKTITMTGHFFRNGDASSEEQLFIARCEALVTPTTKVATPLQSLTASNTETPKLMINLTLNEDMSIETVSSNVKSVLGYTKNEMIGNWLGRYVATDDLHKFEALQQKFFHHEQQQQQQQQQQQNKQKAIPLSVCEVFDVYTNNGEGCLTFLFQIRSRRQRRSKPIQFVISAQLIDPLLRNEYVNYVQSEGQVNLAPNKMEQVNFAPPSVSKTIKDTILANSPPLVVGYSKCENGYYNDIQQQQQQQYSPFQRCLSNFVEPVDFVDQSWQQLFDFDANPCSSTTGYQCWPSNNCFDNSIMCQSERELKSIFDEYIEGYSMPSNYC